MLSCSKVYAPPLVSVYFDQVYKNILQCLQHKINKTYFMLDLSQLI
jgi:hypothetical protein